MEVASAYEHRAATLSKLMSRASAASAAMASVLDSFEERLDGLKKELRPVQKATRALSTAHTNVHLSVEAVEAALVHLDAVTELAPQLEAAAEKAARGKLPNEDAIVELMLLVRRAAAAARFLRLSSREPDGRADGACGEDLLTARRMTAAGVGVMVKALRQHLDGWGEKLILWLGEGRAARPAAGGKAKAKAGEPPADADRAAEIRSYFAEGAKDARAKGVMSELISTIVDATAAIGDEEGAGDGGSRVLEDLLVSSRFQMYKRCLSAGTQQLLDIIRLSSSSSSAPWWSAMTSAEIQPLAGDWKVDVSLVLDFADCEKAFLREILRRGGGGGGPQGEPGEDASAGVDRVYRKLATKVFERGLIGVLNELLEFAKSCLEMDRADIVFSTVDMLQELERQHARLSEAGTVSADVQKSVKRAVDVLRESISRSAFGKIEDEITRHPTARQIPENGDVHSLTSSTTSIIRRLSELPDVETIFSFEQDSRTPPSSKKSARSKAPKKSGSKEDRLRVRQKMARLFEGVIDLLIDKLAEFEPADHQQTARSDGSSSYDGLHPIFMVRASRAPRITSRPLGADLTPPDPRLPRP